MFHLDRQISVEVDIVSQRLGHCITGDWDLSVGLPTFGLFLYHNSICILTRKRFKNCPFCHCGSPRRNQTTEQWGVQTEQERQHSKECMCHLRNIATWDYRTDRFQMDRQLLNKVIPICCYALMEFPFLWYEK